jgi:hypothetical protein
VPTPGVFLRAANHPAADRLVSSGIVVVPTASAGVPPQEQEKIPRFPFCILHSAFCISINPALDKN